MVELSVTGVLVSPKQEARVAGQRAWQWAAERGRPLANLPAIPGALQDVQTWAGYNGATAPVSDSAPSLDLTTDAAGLDSVITRYTTFPPGGAVELWTINGGHHTPTFYNGTSASEFAPLVIDWLLAHPKP